MLSRQVLIGYSRVLSVANGHFKFCESVNGSHHRYPNAKYVYKSAPTFMFARLASSSSAVPPEITKVIEKVAADSPSSNWPSVEELVSSIGPLPDIPQLPSLEPPVLEILANGEPSLASLGLAGYWPNGICQQLLEATHLYLGIPWWSSVVLLTAIVRICLFPIVVRQIKASAGITSGTPKMQSLQLKIRAARGNNDRLSEARYQMEFAEVQKSLNVLEPVKYMSVQGFILISFTSGLRGMCNLPVESLQTGGFWHVQDLTAYDPTCLLPIACGLALHLSLRLGMDFSVSSTSEVMKNVFLYGFPLVTIAVALNMQNFICIYWIANGCIAILQGRAVKSPRIRKYFQIPDVKPPPPSVGPKKGIFEILKDLPKGIQEGMRGGRIAREVKERQLMDELSFERAGREPIRKTYKYNPKATVLPKKLDK